MLGIHNIPTTIAIITIHLNRIAIGSLDLLGFWHCWGDCVKMNLWLWACPKSTVYGSGSSTPFWQIQNSTKANCFLVSDDLHRCCQSYNVMSQPQVVNRTEFYRCSSQISVLTLGFRKETVFCLLSLWVCFGIIHAVGPKVPPKKEPIGESIAVAGIKGISSLSMFKCLRFAWHCPPRNVYHGYCSGSIMPIGYDNVALDLYHVGHPWPSFWRWPL